MLELFDQSLNFLVVKVVKKDIPIRDLELLLLNLNNYSLLRNRDALYTDRASIARGGWAEVTRIP